MLNVPRHVKDKARGDLDQSDWVKQGYFLDESCTTDKKPVGEIAREHVLSLSVPAFVKRYEEPNLPVVIDGIADEWPAMNGAWEPRALFATYRHRRFRCGEDDDGYPVKMKLKYFLRYMAGWVARLATPCWCPDLLVLAFPLIKCRNIAPFLIPAVAATIPPCTSSTVCTTTTGPAAAS